MTNKLHSRVAIGDWLTVNCRLVEPQQPEEDDDMITDAEYERVRQLIENAEPVEESDDDFDLDYLI